MLEYLWLLFLNVAKRRQQGIDGPLPLSFSELRNWSELMHVELTPFEVETIMSLDDVALEKK